MGTAFIVIIVLLIMGCSIAYFGDTWGYKLGKKRLTLFGLRPRVTANLLTVIAGGVIVLLTLGVLLALNAGFRTALTHGQQLLYSNHQLKRSNITLSGNKRDLENQNNLLRQQQQQDAANAQQYRASAIEEKKKAVKEKGQLKVLDHEKQVAQNEVVVAQNRVNALNNRVALLQTQTKRLNQTLTALGDKAKVDITHHQIFPNGAEVGRTVIASSQSQTAIRRDIIDFLGRLSSEAKMQGAARGPNGSYAPVATVRFGNTSTLVDENDSISALAGQIHNQGKGSVVVIAYSVGNSFDTKPVFIRLKPYANRLVIPAGAILGETIIPSRQEGVTEILAEMESFVKGPVHQVALRRGLIPVLPQDYIGGANSHELDPAIQQIQQIKGDAVLVAVSRQDTYAGDQLSLDFAVHAASGQSVAAQATRP